MQLLGGHIQTKENFLYGKFETLMRPAYGSGVVSSFFTFFDGPDFKTNWNEIDFEILGRNTNSIDTNVIRTVKGVTDNNVNVRHGTLPKRASDEFWKLTLEWRPHNITWSVNDTVIRTLIIALPRRQKLMLNCWAGGAGWAGEINTGLLPQIARYEFIEYSKWSNGGFIPVWRDSFHALDEKRWYVSEGAIGQTRFSRENVGIVDSRLVLTLLAR